MEFSNLEILGDLEGDRFSGVVGTKAWLEGVYMRVEGEESEAVNIDSSF